MARGQHVDRGVAAAHARAGDKRPEAAAFSRNDRDQVSARGDGHRFCGVVHAAADLNDSARSVEGIQRGFCGCGQLQMSHSAAKQITEAPQPVEARHRLVRTEEPQLPTQGKLPAFLQRRRRHDESFPVILRKRHVGLAEVGREGVLSVDVPRDLETERGGDCGKHVNRPRSPADGAPPTLMWELDEQRNVGDVLKVGVGGGPPLLASPEAKTLVSGDDHERAVIEPPRPQAGNEPSEDAVGKSELEQVALPILVDRRLVVCPDLRRAPAGRLSERITLPGGQEAPGAVWEQRVEVPERRSPGRSDRRQEPLEASFRIRSTATVAPKVLPTIRDRGDAVREVIREQLVQVDDGGSICP